jgi:hypothetical protein
MFSENLELYSLEGQFNHKIAFIQNFIPSHVQIIGIGHSVGCKVWLETIKSTQALGSSKCAQITKCFMLFPTIERMRVTPNGKNLMRFLPYQRFVEHIIWLITLLPTAIHRMFLRLYFFGRSIPDNVQKASLELFKFSVLHRSILMARLEMEEIYDLDDTTVGNNLDKLFFYFGTTDQWCPLEYAEGMKQKFPTMSFKICDRGYEHAFVIKDSIGMSEIISSLVVIPE